MINGIMMGLLGALFKGNRKCISSREADRRVAEGRKKGLGVWIRGMYYVVGEKEPITRKEYYKRFFNKDVD